MTLCNGNALILAMPDSLWTSLVAQPAMQKTWVLSLGRPPGEENGKPFRYSCLENSMDRGARQAAAYRVSESRTQLSDAFTFHFHYIILYHN